MSRIVLLGAERAHLAVRDLAARGCAAAIVLASGYTETGEDGARRQKQLVEAAGAMRILGPNTIGLVNLTDAIVLSATGALEMDEFPVGGIGVVSQSGGILGSLAVACRGARHRAVQADLHQQRGRPRAGRLHRSPRRRSGHQGHRAVHRDGAQPGEVPRRVPEGRARRQAGGGLQDRPLRGGRPGRGLAHRRDGRCRSHVRRAVPAGRRDPRQELRRPARRARRAGHGPHAARQARGDPHLDRRRGHAGLRRPRRGRLRHARARCGDGRRAARAADRQRGGAGPQPDRRDARRPAARSAARRDPHLAAEPELRRADHHRRLLQPGAARADGRRDPGLPARDRQAGARLREPACAGGRRAAHAPRRAGLRGGRELHRGAGRHAAREPLRGAQPGTQRRGAGRHGRRAVRPQGLARRGPGQAALRPLRRAVRGRTGRRHARPRPKPPRRRWAGAWC